MLNLKQNWAGNQTFQARRVHRPESIEEIQRLIAGSDKVKAIGARHSFTTIADTQGDLISMEHFNDIISIDESARSVTVGAGMRYGLFCAELHRAGYAVHNMASLPHITVGGACATATHGSGDQNGNLATAVSAMKIVTGEGDVVERTRGEHKTEFPGVVVGLGGFGVVTHLTLDIRPAYSVRQDIYEDLPLASLLEHFDEIMSRGYSVSLFTDWQGEYVNQVWVKRLFDEREPGVVLEEIHGAKLAAVKRHPLPSKSADSCTEQLGMSGPWFERLPHFRMDALGASGDELQTEYFVSRRYARQALEAVAGLKDHLAPVIKLTEIRTIAADDLWMSPGYHREHVGIHFSWIPDWPSVQTVLPLIEESLEPFDARPHWGKLFVLSPERIEAIFPRFHDFRSLMKKYDPAGKFRNTFLNTYIFGTN